METRLNRFINRTISTQGVIAAAIALFSCLATGQTVAAQQQMASQIEPSIIKRPTPVYPQYAVKHQVEGAVLVNFSIDQTGNTSDIAVVASEQDGIFDATAILAVQKWSYTKPTQKVRNNYVSFEFVLSDQSKVRRFRNVEIVRVKGK